MEKLTPGFSKNGSVQIIGIDYSRNIVEQVMGRNCNMNEDISSWNVNDLCFI